MICISRLLVILVCILCMGCRDKSNAPASPGMVSADSLISPGKMILILADVHEIEAALMLERNEGGVSKSDPDLLYRGLFEKYRISPGRYQQNLAHYRKDPESFEKIYEKVVLLLESKQKNHGGK